MKTIDVIAWHPSVKRWFKWKEIKRRTGYRWMFVTRGETNVAEWGNPKLIKCLFTGIKDIHGKKIYQGHIVKVIVQNIESEYEVAWDSDNCGFYLIHAKREGDEFGVYTRRINIKDKYEIIGHIYENR